MDQNYVVYWSQGDNTRVMADGAGAGITEAGKEAAVVDAASATADELKAAGGGLMCHETPDKTALSDCAGPKKQLAAV